MEHANLASEELWSNPRLRIALITETYPPEINGVAMTLGRMVNGLSARGHRIQLIRPKQGAEDGARLDPEFEELLAKGWKLPRYEGLRFGLPAKTALVRSWTRQRPDLVHVATEGPLGWTAVSAATKLKLPVSSDFHTNFDHYSRHYGIGWMRRPVTAYLRRFHNRTACTFVPTAEMATTLLEQGYRNIDVVARGVDTTLFSPQRRNEALRAEWGASPEDVVAISVGRLAPEKNLFLTVKAFRAIRAELPSAKLVFVGDGPMKADLMREFPDAVFAGMRINEDLAEHYASADLFLFPSLSETFGNVTLEAMASGLCAVCYRYAAAAENITDAQDGLLVECGDEEAFISAARRGVLEGSLRRLISRAARERALTLDWEAVNDRFAQALVRVWSEALPQQERRNEGSEA